jgi:hypothetical protein
LISFPVSNGVIRDIVVGEAEFGGGGVSNCPNFYTNIVVTLPANVNYYTYQLRTIFITSSQDRTLSDLCPIAISTSASGVQTQTENGVLGGLPVVQNGSGTFFNSPSGSQHHFSQFISASGKGSGIIFTEKDNQRLYAFDAMRVSQTGSLNVTGTRLIELLPVDLGSVVFKYAYDITWQGAVATFDNTVPVCNLYDGTTPAGLWILTEYPPTLTVTAKN